jgi:hypothetical protein
MRERKKETWPTWRKGGTLDRYSLVHLGSQHDTDPSLWPRVLRLTLVRNRRCSRSCGLTIEKHKKDTRMKRNDFIFLLK